MVDFSELNAEQLEARKTGLLRELETPETRDKLSTEDMEACMAEILAIDAELESRKQAAAEEARKAEEVARMTGEPIIKQEEKKMDIKSAEYRELWLRNLQGNLSDEEKRAYATGTSGDNKATNAIPTLIADKFFEKMKKLAPMLSEITLLRVAGNINFVAEGTRNSADAKHTENSALTPAADTTVSVSLGAYEFMKVISISRTAKMMSIDAFEGWLIEMLAGDIARSIDNFIINDNNHGIDYITWASNTNQIVNTTFTYKSVCDLIALLPAAYDAEAKFLVNKATLYGTIAQIVDSAGRPIFVPDTVTGVGGRLMGYPVVVDDYVNTTRKTLYLGKWSDVVGNLSEDINVEANESAGFTANSIVYRGVAAFDSKPAKADAIVRLVSTTA